MEDVTGRVLCPVGRSISQSDERLNVNKMTNKRIGRHRGFHWATSHIDGNEADSRGHSTARRQQHTDQSLIGDYWFTDGLSQNLWDEHDDNYNRGDTHSQSQVTCVRVF